ncbi:MAG: type IV pilus assembly protein PilM [Minisyncoccia bacterium]
MRVLGIDIGTTNIKVVELSEAGDQRVLENYGILETYGYLERNNATIQSNYFKLVEDITVDLIKKLFLVLKPKTKRAIFSLPVFSSFITQFDLPFVDKKEIANAVIFEAKKYIPVPLDDLEISWMLVGQINEGTKQKSSIVLIATPKELIDKYKRMGEMLGLNVVGWEIEGISLVRSLIKGDKRNTLIVDMGTQITNFFIVENGFLTNYETLNIGGAEITHVISRSMGVTKERAEEFKKIKGFKVDPQEMGVVNILMPIVDNFGNEILRMMDIYQQKTNKKIERIIITGGGANMPGLVDYFTQFLNMPVEKAWPFQDIKYADFLEPLLRDVAPFLSVATGAALRGLE